MISVIPTDPLDLIVEGDMCVRDLRTREECDAEVLKLEMEIESIIAQIAESETDPARRGPGWRTRAQSAIRWKKRVRSAIKNHAATLRPARHKPDVKQQDDKQRVILDTVRLELGEDEFARLVAVAKSRHPHLFAGGAAC
ncbi:hypothetical protein [Mesorhizobium sp. KR1-2]|uniref:hypothetical protein n=1 Tax=Mesorhizobium sp. KR1-2 TaxID=3156609 RepID=UPI0032B4F326